MLRPALTPRAATCSCPQNIALSKPRMTREEFFVWAQARDIRCEFEGFEPVA